MGESPAPGGKDQRFLDWVDLSPMWASSEVFSLSSRASFCPRLPSFLFRLLAADFAFSDGRLRDIALPPRFKKNAFGGEVIPR
jgi:hypothetical protein